MFDPITRKVIVKAGEVITEEIAERLPKHQFHPFKSVQYLPVNQNAVSVLNVTAET